jgi:hypothetical protein
MMSPEFLAIIGPQTAGPSTAIGAKYASISAQDDSRDDENILRPRTVESKAMLDAAAEPFPQMVRWLREEGD